jgi:hypothetical protein
VTDINLGLNGIASEGASALAGALKVNTSMTMINLSENEIGDEGALALVDALKVNTSVTCIDLDNNELSATSLALVDELMDRNMRLRHLFIFDARKMLLSLMCADECGVVWPYLLEGDDLNVTAAPDNVETVRAEFAAVVEERRRRSAAAARLVAVDKDDEGGSAAVKRRRTKR